MLAKTALVAAIATFGVAIGLSQVTNAQGPSPPAGDAAAAARGAKAWADNCGSCHNIRSPLEKTDAQWAIASTHMRVRANLPGDMVDDIIVFLQSSNVEQGAVTPATAPVAATAPAIQTAVVAGDAARGAQIYGETCVACHGENGKGAIPGVPDLRQRLTQSDEVLMQHMIEGYQSPGSPMPMPPRGGNPDLTDQDMADVLAYLRANFGR